MPGPYAEFGQKLRRIREKAGFASREEAAPNLGVSPRSLGSYERGESLPDVDFLCYLALASGVDLGTLIDERIRMVDVEMADAIKVSDRLSGYNVRSPSPAPADHARRALLSAGDPIDEHWRLAIMEMAAREEITAAGVDRLIRFIRDSGKEGNV